MDPGAWTPIFGSEPLYGSSPWPPCNGLGLWTHFSNFPHPKKTIKEGEMNNANKQHSTNYSFRDRSLFM